jgi:hypothetical protein
VRRALQLLARSLQQGLSRARGQGRFRQAMAEVEDLLGFAEIRDAIRAWRDARGLSPEEVFVVILPDEELFLLPLSFLGASEGAPWVLELGGVSTAVSLLGSSAVVGPNPLGFLSSLHSIGAVSVVAALWPVSDDVAVRFGGELSCAAGGGIRASLPWQFQR